MSMDKGKVYGDIPGIPVGKLWMKRSDLKDDHMHTHNQGGISWGDQGAFCVVLSGAYEDDVDEGDQFVYTGSGDLHKDQSFDKGGNKALQTSVATQNPVRVIRGANLDSRFAPEEGYRYDGLYYVKKAWMDRSEKTEKAICRFFFVRKEGQPPLVEYKYRQVYKDRMTAARKRWNKPKGNKRGYAPY